MKPSLIAVIFALFLGSVFAGDAELNSVQKLNHLRKEKLVNAAPKRPKNLDPPAGPYCQTLIAYYAGTVQNKHSSTTGYDVQFQLRLNADLQKERIFVETDEWNEDYSKSKNFEIDFYYEDSHQWCKIGEKDCSASFAKSATTFWLDLNGADRNSYHLMYFDYFNNSFVLNKPRGQCTKHQLDGIHDDWTPDLEDLSFCVCCGDEYLPEGRLGCPSDQWKPVTTPAPTKPPVTIPAPVPRDITCSSIVGYYSGFFQNTLFPSDVANVEFQARLVANDVDREIYFTIDHWNDQKAAMSDFTMHLGDIEDWFECSPIDSTNCKVAYVQNASSSYVNVDIFYKSHNDMYFMYFPSPFNNRFVLNNAIGKCTKEQIGGPFANTVNTTLFNYCLCCDDYLPDPALNCPTNPWV